MNRKRLALIAALVIVAAVAIGAGWFFLPTEAGLPAIPFLRQPTPTPVPPTPTPDPTANWNTFEDPFGKFTIKYPPGWYVRPATSSEPGSATYITTFDLRPQFEGRAAEVVVPEGEFMVTLGLETTDVVPKDQLLAWAMERYSFFTTITESGPFAVGEDTGAMLGINNGEASTYYFFATQSGVLFIGGQPISPGMDDVLGLAVSTLEILP